MKRIVSIIIVGLILALLFLNMFDGVLQFNKMETKNTDGQAYIEKNVTERTKNDVMSNANISTPEVVFGKSSELENGSANIVTSIVVDYRSFDTLGEVTVLFISSLGVSFLLGGLTKRVEFADESSFILRVGTELIFGFILILGVYMFLHGHLTPGGGFPGGALIGGGFLLRYLSDNKYRAKIQLFKVLEGTAGSIYILLGVLGLLMSDYFLQNFLDTGTVGELFSSGVIPIVYVLIGLKVGSELTGIFDHFMNEEV